MVSLSNHERAALRQACLELAERLRANGSRTHNFYLVELLAAIHLRSASAPDKAARRVDKPKHAV